MIVVAAKALVAENAKCKLAQVARWKIEKLICTKGATIAPFIIVRNIQGLKPMPSFHIQFWLSDARVYLRGGGRLPLYSIPPSALGEKRSEKLA